MLFNDAVFKLKDGEEVQSIDSLVKAEYMHRIDPYPVQIPLYKYINHEKYDLYMGIPYNASIEAMLGYEVVNSDQMTLSTETDSSTYLYRRYSKPDGVLVEFVRSDRDNLIYVLSSTNSEDIADRLFSRNELSNRFSENTQ